MNFILSILSLGADVFFSGRFSVLLNIQRWGEKKSGVCVTRKTKVKIYL